MSPSSLQTPIKALGREKRLQCVRLRVQLGEPGGGPPGGSRACAGPHGETACVLFLARATQISGLQDFSAGPLLTPPLPEQVSPRRGESWKQTSLGSTPDLPFQGPVA